jgi:1,4-dihydroxy-2-naphthoate octaprenyltransferase
VEKAEDPGRAIALFRETQPMRALHEKSPPARRAPGPRIAGRAAARSIWIDLLLYPTHTLPTALAPVLVGAGLAVRDGVFAPLPVLLGFLGSWAVHVAGVLADNHELLRKHPAIEEHPELTRAVADGTLRLSTLRAAIAACLALAALAAPYLYRIGGAPVLALGAIGVVVSVSYNVAPWAYVRRGWAAPVFFAMFGIVAVVGTYYIGVAAHEGAPSPWRLLASLPASVLVAGLPAGAIVTSVMLIDDIRDREFDAAKGWRTGAVRNGARFAASEVAALVAFAYVAPALLWAALGLGPWVLLPVASLPLGWRAVAVVWRATDRRELVPWTPRMAGLALLHSALLAAGLALSR